MKTIYQKHIMTYDGKFPYIYMVIYSHIHIHYIYIWSYTPIYIYIIYIYISVIYDQYIPIIIHKISYNDYISDIPYVLIIFPSFPISHLTATTSPHPSEPRRV
jgi:hypothetical protein